MSKSASLSDKKFKLNVDIAKLESEVDIQKINDWTDKKYDNGAKMTPAEMSFYVAGEVFNERRVHSQHWLQSVYTKVCKEFKNNPRLAVIERYPLKAKATEQEKQMWLTAMNIQIAAFLSNDVELVFKKK